MPGLGLPSGMSCGKPVRTRLRPPICMARIIIIVCSCCGESWVLPGIWFMPGIWLGMLGIIAPLPPAGIPPKNWALAEAAESNTTAAKSTIKFNGRRSLWFMARHSLQDRRDQSIYPISYISTSFTLVVAGQQSNRRGNCDDNSGALAGGTFDRQLGADQTRSLADALQTEMVFANRLRLKATAEIANFQPNLIVGLREKDLAHGDSA